MTIDVIKHQSECSIRIINDELALWRDGACACSLGFRAASWFMSADAMIDLARAPRGGRSTLLMGRFPATRGMSERASPMSASSRSPSWDNSRRLALYRFQDWMNWRIEKNMGRDLSGSAARTAVATEELL